jgi:peptide/nickel transport system substrate-binding protein
MHIIPCIAKKLEDPGEGKSIYFNLRGDIFFHENNSFDIREEFNVIHNKNNPIRVTRKVVASDFVFSLKRLVDPLVASPCAWVLKHVERDSVGGFGELKR